MKFTPCATFAATLLLAAATSYAGDGFLTKLGRNLGYGISDGYHAQRDCLGDPSCGDCSPIMQQPMVPQPMMQQPMMHHPMVQQSVTQQPVLAPAYSYQAPPQFQQASYPVGYPVTQPYPYQPWYQPDVSGYAPPATPPPMLPGHRPGMQW